MQEKTVSPVKPTSYRERCFIQKHGIFLLRNVNTTANSHSQTSGHEAVSSPAADNITKTS